MANSTNLTRRAFLSMALASTALCVLPKSALAFTTDQAQALVGRLVGDINSIIASGKSESGMIRDFERVLVRYADMNIIAQTVLGPPWRSASASQRRAFTAALQGYLARKYGKRFREFIGGQIEVQSARSVRNFFEVKSTAKLRGQAPFEVVFLVSDRSGKELFFNMIIEGINLRTTENTEINAMLDRKGGNLDALISEVNSAG